VEDEVVIALFELRRNAELWRILTCHFTHWSYGQLAWDALAFTSLAVVCFRRDRRAFYATLCGEGARVDRFEALPTLPLLARARVQGSATAVLQVPHEAALFADHFPRRPVFPGTLLLDRMTALAGDVAIESARGRHAALRAVSDVKLRAFIEPGTELELHATIEETAPPHVTAKLEARAHGQRRPVGSARVRFEVSS
jgi:3-hydroxyacyl-[acyl-carrier-protein] dehydratase